MGDPPSMQDRDLLSRLNALKKSTIELDAKQYCTSPPGPSNPEVPPLVAHELHNDILDRFRTLRSADKVVETVPKETKSSAPLDRPELQTEENDKIVEDLLAELGPGEEWTMNKDEEDQVSDLLRDAKAALKDASCTEKDAAEPNDQPEANHQETQGQHEGGANPSDIDLSVFRPEVDTDSDDDVTKKPQSKAELKQSLDKEADETLQRVLDEIKQEESTCVEDPDDDEHDKAQNNSPHNTSPAPLDLPSPNPFKTITAAAAAVAPEQDNNNNSQILTTRFSALTTLPSVPTAAPTSTSTSTSTSTPSTSNRTTTPPNHHADEEIETWCIICTDDATLKCVGCDGDLYCTNCWMEGHRGDGAGSEEKSHRAVQYSRKLTGMGKKEEKQGKGVNQVSGLRIGAV